jgi:hypothetical protein
MTAGARNILRSNDSASLWNYTVAPGIMERKVLDLSHAFLHSFNSKERKTDED